ncbi:enhanced disease susceptibility 1 [Datura stramonium]|uniref:Enhanced disease susceptibility 1 n=1 Tax=Datura stramonium TaxID=4076 RepID=A0ABS8WQR3_DATST|nr:enhanced disease susceptibility 1 [Datura stramonium]
MQDVVCLNNLTDIPLSSNVIPSDEVASYEFNWNDLGLSTRARLCLRAAGEWEKRKKKNEEKIDLNKKNIVDGLSEYRSTRPRNEDTGPYMFRARPTRYRFTQRWLEHAERVQTGARSESCFWAEVEELRNKPFAEVQNRVLSLETNAWSWFQTSLLGSSDVFFLVYFCQMVKNLLLSTDRRLGYRGK